MGYEQILGAKMEITRHRVIKLGRTGWSTASHKNMILGNWKRLPRGAYF